MMVVEGQVIEKIKAGSDKAFRTVYEMYFIKVFNYALKFIKSPEDAREIAQDVFVKLWDKRASLDSEQPISGLIFRIAKFLSIDRLRKQSKVKFLELLPVHEKCVMNIEEDMHGVELYGVYNGILERLPPKRKLIFEMSRDHNMTYNEIAVKLHISPRTVETQISLALRQIRTEIVKYSDSMIVALVFIELIRIAN